MGRTPGCRTPPPEPLRQLVERYDRDVFDTHDRRARVRLGVGRATAPGTPCSTAAAPRSPRPDGDADATLSADLETWERVAADVRGGMAAFEAGRLTIRRDLHLGVGFLAATSGMAEPGRLTLPDRRDAARQGRRSRRPARARRSIAIHGLGATKASFLPTIAALADDFTVTALDLPGFGDSDKPIGAPYDARFFADAVVALLDALEIERAHLVGNSLGGRVALEVGARAPRARAAPGAARAVDGVAAQAAVGAAAAARAARARRRPARAARGRRADRRRRSCPAAATAGPPPASTSSCART